MPKFFADSLQESIKNALSGLPNNLLITMGVLLFGFFAFRFLFPAIYKAFVRFCSLSIGLLKSLLLVLLVVLLLALLLTFAINFGRREKGPPGTKGANRSRHSEFDGSGGGRMQVEVGGVSRESLEVRVLLPQGVSVIRGADPFFQDKLQQAFSQIGQLDNGSARDVYVRTGRFVPTAVRLQILQILEWSGDFSVIESGER